MSQPGRAAADAGQQIRLAMWSGPRNISTALMRSWETRPDCVVVDEPLYAYYLAATDIDHPARDEVIAAGETDVARVVASLTGPVPDDARIHYQKHMTYHLLPAVGLAWLAALTNVLLIRHPAEVVASYQRSRNQVEPADIGLLQQRELYVHLVSVATAPPVIDAADFLRQPAVHLEWLCDLIGVPFTTGMLTWPAGPWDTSWPSTSGSFGCLNGRPRPTGNARSHPAGALMATTDLLERDRSSFDDRAWTDAHRLLSAADQDVGLVAPDLERLATAAYLVGLDEDSVDVWARAHQSWRTLGRTRVAPGARSGGARAAAGR